MILYVPPIKNRCHQTDLSRIRRSLQLSRLNRFLRLLHTYMAAYASPPVSMIIQYSENLVKR